MSILVDWQILSRCEAGMITPFDRDLVNPASLDIRVGSTAIIETENGDLDVDLSGYSKEEPFWLLPGDCILVSSLEEFNIPSDIAAKFFLKSSRGREFYEQLEAGFIDPGFHSSLLTMEIVNMNRYRRRPLYPGFRIGQIVFFELSRQPAKDYSITGRYNHSRTVLRSKG